MLFSASVNAHIRRAELLGWSAMLAVGIGLDWLCRTHPGHLPFWAPCEFSWTAFLGAGSALLCYVTGLARIATRPSAWRQAAFLIGLLLIYSVWQTRFQYMSEHMFFLNRVQHMVMHHIGPFLIALAWPGRTLWCGTPKPLRHLVEHPRLENMLSTLQQPLIATLLFDGLLFLWLYPPVHFRAMIDVDLYRVMNLSMVGDGLLFWFLILDPRPRPPARLTFQVRLVLVMAIQVPQIMVGALLALVPQDLYPFYTLCGRLYPELDSRLDQELGGFVVYFPGAMMSAIAGLILFRWLWVAESRLHLPPLHLPSFTSNPCDGTVLRPKAYPDALSAALRE